MRKYIGYGYTNNQGIATLDYDANGTAITPSGYLGTGGGEIDIQAELHDDSSIVSEIYEVLDATFLDRGTISSHNDTYFYPANIERDFTRGDTDTSVVMASQNSGTVSHSVGDGMRFEMDVTEMETYCQVNIVRTETDKSPSYHGQKYTSACKIRIDVLPTQILFKQVIDGVETTVQTINNSTNNTFRIYFVKSNGESANALFHFKNFAIYPI